MGRWAEDKFRIWCLTGGEAADGRCSSVCVTLTSTVLCPHWPASSRNCPAAVSSAPSCWAAVASAAPACFPEPAGKFGSSANIPSAGAPPYLTHRGQENPPGICRFTHINALTPFQYLIQLKFEVWNDIVGFVCWTHEYKNNYKLSQQDSLWFSIIKHHVKQKQRGIQC